MPERRGPKEDFKSLVGDVKPLAKKRIAAPPRARSARAVLPPGERQFLFPDPDEPLLGRAHDCDAKRFERLRRGRMEMEVRVDLHGLRKRAARVQLETSLRDAWNEGVDYVLVIHGRGRSSEQAPVIKQALPGWLTKQPLAERVLAFAPAKQADGGVGATYVLLRPA